MFLSAVHWCDPMQGENSRWEFFTFIYWHSKGDLRRLHFIHFPSLACWWCLMQSENSLWEISPMPLDAYREVLEEFISFISLSCPTDELQSKMKILFDNFLPFLLMLKGRPLKIPFPSFSFIGTVMRSNARGNSPWEFTPLLVDAQRTVLEDFISFISLGWHTYEV